MKRRAYLLTSMGRMCRRARKKLGLSLKRCAEKVGVSRQAIHQLETGKTKGSNSKLIENLVQVLDLNINELEAVRPKRKLCEKKRNNPLGDYLTRRRLKVHLTQNELARRAGIGRFLSDIEQGKCVPKYSTLNKIAGVLECEMPKKLVLK